MATTAAGVLAGSDRGTLGAGVDRPARSTNGTKRGDSMDLAAACSGFIYALQVGTKWLGSARNAAAPAGAEPTRLEYLPAASTATTASRSLFTSWLLTRGELSPIMPRP